MWFVNQADLTQRTLYNYTAAGQLLGLEAGFGE